MALEPSFRSSACPPLLGTFSFGYTPFPRELPTSAGLPPDAGREQVYLDWCRRVANTDGLGNLEWVYGRDIKGTLVEICSSIVVRSEHQFTSDERRLCLRKHVYELDHPATPFYPPGDPNDPRTGTARALAYDALRESDRFGRYLGFMDLRWLGDGPAAGGESPLALGVLALPKRYRGDPAVVAVLGGYGPVFGGPSFRATVYSMADSRTGGAVCAQACAIMALGLLSDRGARPIGSHNITFLGRRRVSHSPATRTPLCAAANVRYSPAAYYDVGGLNPASIRNVLNSRDANGESRCRVSADLIHYPAPGRLPDRLITRLLECHIDARFPVILAVHADTWNAAEIRDEKLKAAGPEVGHAVVAAGYRRTGIGPDDLAFLIHDPSSRPFVQRARKSVIDALRAYASATRPAGEVFMVPVADHRVRTHLHACVAWLRGPDGRAFHADPAVNRPDLSAALEGYLTSPEHELKLALVERNYTGPLFQPTIDRSCQGNLARAVGGVAESRRLWCVIGMRANQFRHLWLFDAERDTHVPRLVLEVNGYQVETLYRAAEATDPPDEPADAPPATPITRQPLDPPLPPIEVSVLSSCSTRRLCELLTDVATATGSTLFDLMALREVDVREITSPTPWPPPVFTQSGRRPANELTRYLGIRDPAGTDGTDVDIAAWMAGQLGRADQLLGHPADRKCRVAALATYLPWLSAVDTRLRNEAVRALTNAVLVACRLHRGGRMTHAVVETTCGTCHDPCWCTHCHATPYGRCHVSPPTVKRRILLDSLSRVVNAVRATPVSAAVDHRFYIALEYEPGVSYNLNSLDALDFIFDGVDARPELVDHVGVNLDIAHMRIDRVSAADLATFAHRILHSHVADHPELLHTRDLPPGLVTPALTTDSPYFDYFQLLSRRLADTRKPGYDGLPFTGACAIELEGVDRTDYVYHGIPTTRHVAVAASRWG